MPPSVRRSPVKQQKRAVYAAGYELLACVSVVYEAGKHAGSQLISGLNPVPAIAYKLGTPLLLSYSQTKRCS